MKRISGLAVALTAVTLLCVAGEQATPVTYYVQLIRGVDGDTPPEPKCHRVGPKLVARFEPVLKWKSYWEISRKTVVLNRGEKARVTLNQERAVEIDLSHAQKRYVTYLARGQIVDRTISPAGDCMTITGGERDATSVWFIVVRRDEPHWAGENKRD